MVNAYGDFVNDRQISAITFLLCAIMRFAGRRLADRFPATLARLKDICMKIRSILFAAGLTLATAAGAQTPCGGDFGAFVTSMQREAQSKGHSPETVARFFRSVQQDPKVIRADRAQGIFTMPFVDFSRRLISNNRLQAGQRNAKKWDGVFDRVERDYGVSRGVLLAFWAFETDFGAVQGDFNTVNALVTLSHDCRRPELFRPQVFAALESVSYTHLRAHETYITISDAVFGW